ncbi:MAG: DUF4956 domain-containing protein [Lachnospiraceae bacterium]|jgi:hypothetical protein|nr:DUF4956 domain-containing protein [Lachnospiraceae bacterium]
MFESILATETTDSGISVTGLLIAIAVALVLGVLQAFTYRITKHKDTPSQSFSVTLVVLPAVVTVIILLIGNSIARAFSLAGAFQIIRFRSTPGDAKDITYVLFSMAVGLSCGMGFVVYGVIACIIFCAAMLIMDALKFAHPKGNPQILKITIPENMDYQNAFDTLFKKYTSSFQRMRVKTTNLGSLFELHYRITAKPDCNEKEFLDELRSRNGNLSISLMAETPADETF